ncbi:hypothetical protein CEXT_340121 [Caerostris extrusa]|uniref:Ribosomal protein S4 n=1 Tax=Caerostris extrusa TaxID=172846 RepID=A0AAV4PCA6_CAEEX|nr:hypothetical protein CEXT_340121 [Caerostris extrusa]
MHVDSIILKYRTYISSPKLWSRGPKIATSLFKSRKKRKKKRFPVKPELTIAHSTIKRHPFLLHLPQLRNSVLEMDPYFTELRRSSSFSSILNKNIIVQNVDDVSAGLFLGR